MPAKSPAVILNGYEIDGIFDAPRIHGFRPQAPYVIVTGRKYCDWSRTIREVGTLAPIYMRPDGNTGQDSSKSAQWKARMINLLGITTFYESNFDQFTELCRLAIFCNVVFVGDEVKPRTSKLEYRSNILGVPQ